MPRTAMPRTSTPRTAPPQTEHAGNTAPEAAPDGLRIGVALSGGGARGLAHAAVISAFDEMGLKPAAIAGASIGALVGAGWAGGMTGADIADIARARFADSRTLIASLWQLRPQRLSDLFGANAMVSLDSARVIDLVLPPDLPDLIEDLPVRFTAIGTDFYGWSEVRFSAGPLKPALAASIALPAVFRTVQHEGRVLMDGGFSNPLPFDALPKALDFVVAVDVVGGPQSDAERRMPGPAEALFGASQIMMQALIAEKLKHRRTPDLVVRPDINRFRVLDFLKAEEVLAAARPVTDAVKQAIEAALEAREHTGRAG